jgi:cobalamin biosynthesis Mg chelatase CobN
LHELKDQHIPDGLHVIGRPYQEDQIRNTAAGMLGSRGWETVQALSAAGNNRDDTAERQSEVMRELLDSVAGRSIRTDPGIRPAASGWLDSARAALNG